MPFSVANTLCTPEQLAQTPSRRDGVPEELEWRLRVLGCELIQSAGVLLKLPQVAIATAQVLLHRFYYSASLCEHGVQEIALGAVFLACKLEESARKIRELVNVFGYLLCRFRGVPFVPLEFTGEVFYRTREIMYAAELVILTRLAFQVHVNHPHAYLINYLQALELADDEAVAQAAWNCLNDSFRTPVHTQHHPHTIACAVILYATRRVGAPVPDGRVVHGEEGGGDEDAGAAADSPALFWEVFDAHPDDIRDIMAHLARLYAYAGEGPLLRPELPMTVGELVEKLPSLAKEMTSATAQVH